MRKLLFIAQSKVDLPENFTILIFIALIIGFVIVCDVLWDITIITHPLPPIYFFTSIHVNSSIYVCISCFYVFKVLIGEGRISKNTGFIDLKLKMSTRVMPPFVYAFKTVQRMGLLELLLIVVTQKIKVSMDKVFNLESLHEFDVELVMKPDELNFQAN